MGSELMPRPHRELKSVIEIDDVSIQLTKKRIKNVNFRIYPPDGEVRMSAPIHMSMSDIRALASTRLEWIQNKIQRLRDLPRTEPPQYVTGEPHRVWGRDLTLSVVEQESSPLVLPDGDRLVLRVRPGASFDKRQEVMRKWYSQQARDAVPPLIEKWEPILDVGAPEFFVQRMRSRWGSCNISAGTIRLNSELAKRSPESLEYVVVHEMVHLLEPSHNARFKELMDGFLPKWRIDRNALKRI